ncbi:DUF4838 domain-containing protein [Halosimplex sp. J119]
MSPGTAPSTLTVNRLSDDETVAFAAEELGEYLSELLDEPVTVAQRDAYDADAGLWVDTAATLPIELPEVDDPTLDDAIRIETDGSTGVVAGVNPRSALLAVYRYLREQGCRWVRPGPDGEHVPSVATLDPVDVADRPSHRHRGITIEGAVSEDHVRDMIDWAPKVGYNSYFIQFFESYPFFERWYTHENNPTYEPEEFSAERAREIHAECVRAIEKRGLTYHAVGHGWTARALDLPDKGWGDTDATVPEEIEPYLAEVDGERKLHDGIPVNTELCYSNSEARSLLVETIADYAEVHSEVDVLHVWASDGHKNHCECDECVGARPSDLYVQTLNELDAVLTERGVDTRIAFLMYTDLLWPPEEARIENTDRFSLMFAPITRSYAETYADLDLDDLPDLPPYERNDFDYPTDLAENVAFLAAWREAFGGDAFDFDYHLMWDHFRDPGQFLTSDVLATDMRHLDDIGVDGNVSCQVQRVFFPTGLPMVAMGRRLWDGDASFDAIVDDHLETAFGPDADAVRAYLETISDCFEPLYSGHDSLDGDSSVIDPAVASSFEAVADAVAEIQPTIERNAERDDDPQRTSWEYLGHHADICEQLAPALAAKARGNDESAHERWVEVRELVQRREPDLHPALDVYFFVNIFEGTFAVDDE